MSEVYLEPCSNCERRNIDTSGRITADRAVCHIVLDGVHADSVNRQHSLENFVQKKLEDRTLTESEVKFAMECAIRQRDGTCAHFVVEAANTEGVV